MNEMSPIEKKYSIPEPVILSPGVVFIVETWGIAVPTSRRVRVEIFKDATFKLHKWHSNVETLKSDECNSKENTMNDCQSTFAKQQLGPRRAETKLLGLPMNKKEDTIRVDTVNKEPARMKRSALSQIASVYDPLGLISQTTLLGKPRGGEDSLSG